MKFQPSFNEMFDSAAHGRMRINAIIRIIKKYRKYPPDIILDWEGIRKRLGWIRIQPGSLSVP